MTDREKVIKGLETCAGTNNDGDDCTADCLLECPYKGSLCIDRLMYDALAILKEQEAVKPTWSRGKPFCGACGLRIHGGKFCSECGKLILWEGR